MNQLLTRGIVLARTEYGEADRILTLLTPDYGKLRLMAKGVRRVKSKLAGGIELFSVSDITFIRGRGEIGTLISARLDRHYGNIISDIERVQLGYELIKQVHKATEDEPEPAYFELLEQTFAALDDTDIPLALIQLWFSAQLLKLAGFTPNLLSDDHGDKLTPEQRYNFNFEAVAFTPTDQGRFGSAHIKLLRLSFSGHPPVTLKQIQGTTEPLSDLVPLIQAIQKSHISP